MVKTRNQYNNQFKEESENIAEFLYGKFNALQHDIIVPSPHHYVDTFFNYEENWGGCYDFKCKDGMKIQGKLGVFYPMDWKSHMIYMNKELKRCERIFNHERIIREIRTNMRQCEEDEWKEHMGKRSRIQYHRHNREYDRTNFYNLILESL